MALPLLHRTRHDAGQVAAPAAPGSSSAGLGARVPVVHRVGAVAVALVILGFGLLGFAGGLDYFSTSGQPIAGLSSNGLLSTISVVTAAVLVAAAVRGARIASTVMLVIGVLFLVSALANLAVLDSSLNVLAFRFSNVVFSVLVGLVLLLLGAYGRVSGHLPADSPYAHAGSDADADAADADFEMDDGRPTTPAELAAERAMRDAEVAVVQRVASADQRRRVAAMAPVVKRAERREIWMSFDRAIGTRG